MWTYLKPITPFGWFTKLNACDGRNWVPSLNHFTSGDGNAWIWASKLMGCPITTFKSFNGLTKAGFIGSAETQKRQKCRNPASPLSLFRYVIGKYIRLIATAHSAAVSPFGFESTNLYAPQSDGWAWAISNLTTPSGLLVSLMLHKKIKWDFSFLCSNN